MDAKSMLRGTPACSAIILLLVTGTPLRGQDSSLDSLSREPVSTPHDVPPELDGERAQRSIYKHFRDPIRMRYVGGGSAHVWIFVDTAGKVRNTVLLKSSGHNDIDEAAMKAAMEFEFAPARFKGEVVPVWITMPVSLNITKKPYQPLPPPDPHRDPM